jgi:26S proteasome regulatory subunit N9
MAFDAKSKALLDFLEQQAEKAPHVAGEFAQMSDLYTRKLWHQLTLALESFAATENTGPLLQPLYETFVSDFKHKLNKLALARLQVAVAKQLDDIAPQTVFCKEAAEEAGKDDRQARAFILTELARLQLDAGQVDESKALLEDAATYIESAAGIENAGQASYYRAWAGYYKIRGPAAEFYKHALLLLAYAPLTSMTTDEALAISFDLGIAALVGDGLYNFGELLEHPVVATLEQTEFAWLADLLRSFNAGDIAQYESLVQSHHAKLEQQPALLANTTFLKEKIMLMCLTETLFQRIGPSGDRTITFDAIATASNLPVDQVELLVMRALSLKLIRGLLDQVDGTLRVTWVQPRVLQTPQIALMKERLQTWTGTVDKTLNFLQDETPEFAT